MKKIEAYIRDHKFEEVKNALIKVGIKGITAYPVIGRGNQIGKGVADSQSGIITEDILIPKRKVEIFCIEEELNRILQVILEKSRTGKVGDGKIFISDVSEVIKIRTGERVNFKNLNL